MGRKLSSKILRNMDINELALLHVQRHVYDTSHRYIKIMRSRFGNKRTDKAIFDAKNIMNMVGLPGNKARKGYNYSNSTSKIRSNLVNLSIIDDLIS